MKNKTKIKATLISIITVTVLIVLMVIWMYLTMQPTVVLSCKDKQFVGFSNSQLPYQMIPAPNACNGFVEVRSLNGNLICKESSYTKTNQEIIKVPCVNLKGKKGKIVNIIFETYSDKYGNSNGEITATYK